MARPAGTRYDFTPGVMSTEERLGVVTRLYSARTRKPAVGPPARWPRKPADPAAALVPTLPTVFRPLLLNAGTQCGAAELAWAAHAADQAAIDEAVAAALREAEERQRAAVEAAVAQALREAEERQRLAVEAALAEAAAQQAAAATVGEPESPADVEAAVAQALQEAEERQRLAVEAAVAQALQEVEERQRLVVEEAVSDSKQATAAPDEGQEERHRLALQAAVAEALAQAQQDAEEKQRVAVEAAVAGALAQVQQDAEEKQRAAVDAAVAEAVAKHAAASHSDQEVLEQAVAAAKAAAASEQQVVLADKEKAWAAQLESDRAAADARHAETLATAQAAHDAALADREKTWAAQLESERAAAEAHLAEALAAAQAAHDAALEAERAALTTAAKAAVEPQPDQERAAEASPAKPQTADAEVQCEPAPPADEPAEPAPAPEPPQADQAPAPPAKQDVETADAECQCDASDPHEGDVAAPAPGADEQVRSRGSCLLCLRGFRARQERPFSVWRTACPLQVALGVDAAVVERYLQGVSAALDALVGRDATSGDGTAAEPSSQGPALAALQEALASSADKVAGSACFTAAGQGGGADSGDGASPPTDSKGDQAAALQPAHEAATSAQDGPATATTPTATTCSRAWMHDKLFAATSRLDLSRHWPGDARRRSSSVEHLLQDLARRGAAAAADPSDAGAACKSLTTLVASAATDFAEAAVERFTSWALGGPSPASTQQAGAATSAAGPAEVKALADMLALLHAGCGLAQAVHAMLVAQQRPDHYVQHAAFDEEGRPLAAPPTVPDSPRGEAAPENAAPPSSKSVALAEALLQVMAGLQGPAGTLSSSWVQQGQPGASPGPGDAASSAARAGHEVQRWCGAAHGLSQELLASVRQVLQLLDGGNGSPPTTADSGSAAGAAAAAPGTAADSPSSQAAGPVLDAELMQALAGMPQVLDQLLAASEALVAGHSSAGAEQPGVVPAWALQPLLKVRVPVRRAALLRARALVVRHKHSTAQRVRRAPPCRRGCSTWACAGARGAAPWTGRGTACTPSPRTTTRRPPPPRMPRPSCSSATWATSRPRWRRTASAPPPARRPRRRLWPRRPLQGPSRSPL